MSNAFSDSHSPSLQPALTDSQLPEIDASKEFATEIGLRAKFRRFPLSVFVAVLTVHLIVGLWILSATFGSRAVTEDRPIIVTLEGQSTDGEGVLSEPNSTNHEPNPYDLKSIQGGQNPSSAGQTPKQEPTAEISLESSELKTIPVAPPVIQEIKPVAKQHVAPSLIQPAPQANSSSAQVRQLTSSGSRQTDANQDGNGAYSQFGDRSGAPRMVSSIDYLDGPPKPAYPSRAKSRKQEGRVIVRVQVDPGGQLKSVQLIKSSGFDLLDQSALDAVGKTRFKNQSEHGSGFDRLVDIPIDFVLSQ